MGASGVKVPLSSDADALRSGLLAEPAQESGDLLVLAQGGDGVEPLGEFSVRVEDVKLPMTGGAEFGGGDLGDLHPFAAGGRLGSQVVDGGARNVSLAEFATRVGHPFRYAASVPLVLPFW